MRDRLRSNSLLIDIICFCPFCMAVSVMVLERVYVGEVSNTPIMNVSFPSPNDVGTCIFLMIYDLFQ